MTEICTENGRISRVEAIIERIPIMDEKLDKLLECHGNIDGRMESVENRLNSVESSPSRPDKGFIMGVAAVGGLLFEFCIRVVGPAAKPILATMGIVIR